MFSLADNNVWSYIQILGLMFTPGLSFSLFLRKWGKNVSDDIAFLLSIVVSIMWVMFFVSWNSIRGEEFTSDTLLLSAFGAAVIFVLFAVIPNGREVGSVEPVKYKIPMAISVALGLLFGGSAFTLSNIDNLNLDEHDNQTNLIAVEGRIDDNVTLRIYNPEDKLVRVTIYFEDVGSSFPAEVFTDILDSGDNYITLSLPRSGTIECTKYRLIYATSSELTTYSGDIFIASTACYTDEILLQQEALPTTREDLLDYIYHSSLK